MTSRISAEVAAVLRSGLVDQAVVDRYRSHVSAPTSTRCRLWTGAISGRGHARFWVGARADGRDAVVLGHRFGYGLRYGYDQLVKAGTVRHYICDNPLCQNTDHMRPGTTADNSHDWKTRRLTPGSPLRDLRGSLGRARALRAAARASSAGPAATPVDDSALTAQLAAAVAAAADAGLRPVDRDQPPLIELPAGLRVGLPVDLLVQPFFQVPFVVPVEVPLEVPGSDRGRLGGQR